jgi:hypothetical protein
MNVVVAPALDGLALEGLRAFAAHLADPGSGEDTSRQLTAAEAVWPGRTLPPGQRPRVPWS